MNKVNDGTYSFGNLNFWRKAYLILLWLVNIPFSSYLVWGCITGVSGLTLGYLAFPILMTGIVAWTHIAVVNRKLTQLKWVAFFNFIPFLNLIGLLIMLSIIRVTKVELKEASV